MHQEFSKLGLLGDNTEMIYPEARAAGDESLMLFHSGGGWGEQIGAILPDKSPIAAARHYYRFRQPRYDWRNLLPAGFTLREVNAAFLTAPRANRDALLDELCSERPSAEDFLARSFGLCPVAADEGAASGEIAGWCLSEYNTGDCCEVGIATLAPHQRRGLATATGLAFCELAHARDIRQIGWHCFAANRPSVATALKIGFELAAERQAYMAWYDEAENMAANGHSRLWRGEYAAATAWFDAAFAHGVDQAWAYWGAACAAAMLGERAAAFRHLRQAMARGFADRERIRKTEYLARLRDTPEWAALVGPS